FFGGEPLLAFSLLRDLTELATRLAFEHGRDVRFTMTTNATLATEARAQWLARHHFTVMVSIDGDPEMHGAHRPNAARRSSWEAVGRGAPVLLHALGPDAVPARGTLTPGFPDVSEMAARLEGLGFTSVAFAGVEPAGADRTAALGADDYARLRASVEQ